MPPIPATLIFGSLSALLLALLGLNVSRVRTAKKIYIGHDVDLDMTRLIRAHGNAAEWIPVLIIMLLILELGGARHSVLNILGASIVVARLLHAAGVIYKSKMSTVGATLTYVLAVLMPVYGVALHLQAAHA